MIPVHFAPGDLAWLDPETEGEREWLESIPADWSLGRVWSEWGSKARELEKLGRGD